MSELYKGFKIIEVEENLIDELHNKGKLDFWDKRITFYPNMYLELKSNINNKKTALCKVNRSNTYIKTLTQINRVSGIQPRNREQAFALDALMNDHIPIVALTGKAGTGKTLCCLAVALEKIQKKKYDKVIITKPMSQVGKYNLGTLPGGIDEKFNPYLLNYMTNLEQFVGNKNLIQDLLDQHKFDIVPIQLMRGASFANCLVIADEVQVLDYNEMLTIGSRMGENSKIVLLGDLGQRDEKIAKDKTGLYKIVNDKKMKESELCSVIELQKCERSKTAELFADVFEE